MCAGMRASDSLETVEIIIVNIGTVTASDMLMRHVFIILTLTGLQGHTDLIHENNKCFIISETLQVRSFQRLHEDNFTELYIFIPVGLAVFTLPHIQARTQQKQAHTEIQFTDDLSIQENKSKHMQG